MARKRTKKERKKHLKEDQFRETMFSVTKVLKEYRYILLLGVAIVVLLFVLVSMRAERQKQEVTFAADLASPNTPAGPVELKDRAEKVKGQAIEPWILLRLGTKLYELYQKEDAIKGDKTRLEEAKKIFEDIKRRFPDSGSPAHVAGRALEVINEEIAYEPTEKLKKALEIGAGKQRRTPAPRPGATRTPPRTPPERPPVPPRRVPLKKEPPPEEIKPVKPGTQKAPAEPAKPEEPKPAEVKKTPAGLPKPGGEKKPPAEKKEGTGAPEQTAPSPEKDTGK
jgi:hypothetical protein